MIDEQSNDPTIKQLTKDQMIEGQSMNNPIIQWSNNWWRIKQSKDWRIEWSNNHHSIEHSSFDQIIIIQSTTIVWLSQLIIWLNLFDQFDLHQINLIEQSSINWLIDGSIKKSPLDWSMEPQSPFHWWCIASIEQSSIDWMMIVWLIDQWWGYLLIIADWEILLGETSKLLSALLVKFTYLACLTKASSGMASWVEVTHHAQNAPRNLLVSVAIIK